MSVRKRAWTTSKGEQKEAWVVDYVDQAGKRRLKTFAKKKAADNFAATANVEIRAGVHTADSASMTIAEAGKLWLETGEQAAWSARRSTPIASTSAAYRALPWQREAVAALGANGPRVRGQARPRRHARRRSARAALASDGPQGSGLAVLAVERRAGARPRLPQRRSRASSEPQRGRSGRPRGARRASSRSGSTFLRARRSRPLWGPLRAAGGRCC